MGHEFIHANRRGNFIEVFPALAKDVFVRCRVCFLFFLTVLVYVVVIIKFCPFTEKCLSTCVIQCA